MTKLVGILSMQRVYNYGSFLQAYALKQLLLNNGAEKVFFIDIEPGRQLKAYKSSGFFHKLHKVINHFIKGTFFARIRYGKFVKKINESISKSQSILELGAQIPNHLDLVVIGSDEVFNFCQSSSWGFSPQLFGRVSQSDYVISYAGSFGSTTLQKIDEFNLRQEIGNAMSSMESISVRDDNSEDIVRELTHHPRLTQHLDPVLAYDYSKIIAEHKISVDFPYMIIYSYDGRIKDRNEVDQIVLFAKEHNLKIIGILCNYSWCDQIIIPETPFDVLGWFNQAKYVVTDTFHGTIFSVITKTQFCTFIRKGNKQKLTSLLSKLKLSDRASFIVKETLEKQIDFTEPFEILETERQRTNSYIKRAIDKIK